jgi:hypothetical protein
MGRIDAYERQIPVSLARMAASHLFKDGGKLSFPPTGKVASSAALAYVLTGRAVS